MLVCQRVYLLKNMELHFQVLLFVLRNNEFSDNNDARRIRFEPPGAVPTDDLFFLPPSNCGAPPFWSIPFNFSGWSKSVGWFHWQNSTTAWHEQEWMKGMDTSKWRSWYEFQEIISLHEPIIPMAAAPLADLIKTLFQQLLGLLGLPENIWKQDTLKTHGLSSCSFLKIACSAMDFAAYRPGTHGYPSPLLAVRLRWATCHWHLQDRFLGRFGGIPNDPMFGIIWNSTGVFTLICIYIYIYYVLYMSIIYVYVFIYIYILWACFKNNKVP